MESQAPSVNKKEYRDWSACLTCIVQTHAAFLSFLSLPPPTGGKTGLCCLSLPLLALGNPPPSAASARVADMTQHSMLPPGQHWMSDRPLGLSLSDRQRSGHSQAQCLRCWDSAYEAHHTMKKSQREDHPATASCCPGTTHRLRATVTEHRGPCPQDHSLYTASMVLLPAAWTAFLSL